MSLATVCLLQEAKDRQYMYFLSNWLRFLHKQIQNPRSDEMPNRNLVNTIYTSKVQNICWKLQPNQTHTNIWCHHSTATKHWLKMADFLRIRTTLHNVRAVHREVCSTTGDVQYTGRYHECSGGYREYTGGGGVSVHWGDIMSMLGDIMINVGEGHWENNCICMETPVHWTSPGVLMISPTLIMAAPSVLMVSLQCTEHPPVYSWYPHCTEHPCVLMISPSVLRPPGVLNDIPRCTQCYPPVYWTPSGVLHIHYAGWEQMIQLLLTLVRR